MKLDIEYCIDRIGSNKLYEPVFLFDDDTDVNYMHYMRLQIGSNMVQQKK